MKLFIVSGDKRMLYAKEYLKASGFLVPEYSSFDEGARDTDVFILGTPATRDKKSLFMPVFTADVKALLSFGKPILGGYTNFEDEFVRQSIIDYAQNDAFALENALPSSEGCIEIALNRMPITLLGSHCLVCGYGKFGRTLACKLKLLGANVFASARSQAAFAAMRSDGIIPLDILELADFAERFDLIINTIPHIIISEPFLKKVNRDAVIIEAASSPGGIDLNASHSLGLNVISAPGLPGKSAPKSAGEIIARAIINCLGDL